VSAADIEPLGEGRFLITGVLDATSVGPVLKRSALLFADFPSLLVDLAGVKESDSSGLALLIEWLRRAKQKRQQIRFQNMPQQIDALARISEVEDLFHGGGAGAGSSSSPTSSSVSGGGLPS
jgi:phospholipid transport system transporter-binding protein